MTIDLLLNLAPWAVGILAAIGGLFYARAGGRQAERDRQAQERMASIERGQKIEQEISSLSNDDLRERGRKWVRRSDKG